VTGYPFAALVGQDDTRLALLLCAINPRIGGVLLRGEKGTAKSTAARGLAQLLAPGSPFRTLPLGTTEDRLAGGIDLEHTLATGRPQLARGLLAEVDRGVLYVDEVNLLDDHLVDVLLDAAATGTNRVEREGLSAANPARFTLIATMNPEEGTLRPQLLDRFGLCVDVTAETDPQSRVSILARRTGHDRDPAGFAAAWAEATAALSRRLRRARQRLPGVRMPGAVAGYIAELCTSHHVAGHRADLVIARAAAANAAWHERLEVTADDVLAVAELALTHRRRDSLPEPPPSSPPPAEAQPPSPPSEAQPPSDSGRDPAGESAGDSRKGGDADAPGGAGTSGEPDARPERRDQGEPREQGEPGDQDDESSEPVDTDGATTPSRDPGDLILGCGDPFRVKSLAPVVDRLARTGSGRRHRTRSADRRGRYVRSRPATDCRDLALDATLRAAAPHQASRRQPGSSRLVVRPADWQRKVRQRRVGSLVLLVADASSSMGARGRMVASKGAILALLLDAYQKRDRVGLVSFRRTTAEVLLPPTASVEVASRLLRELPIGGRTPLAAGLMTAYQTLRPALTREPNLRPIAVLITDGRATAGLAGGPGDPGEVCAVAARIATDRRVRWIVVDTEDDSGIRLGHAQRIAAALGAEAVTIADLHATDLVTLVKGQPS
jgi:magnesium chelatase subunit D